MSDSHYQQANRRYSHFATSPHSPPAFQFAPYLLNGEVSAGHSPVNPFHSSRPHTHSNLNPNPAPALFSPALSTQTDHNPFDFSHALPRRSAQQQQSPHTTFSSRFAAGPPRSNRIDELGPSYIPPDPSIAPTTSTTSENPKAVPLPRKYNKYKQRSLPGPYSKDLVESLIVVAKEAKAEKQNSNEDDADNDDNDPKDLSLPSVVVAEDASAKARTSSESNFNPVNAVKGGHLDNEITAARDDGQDIKLDHDRQQDQAEDPDREPSPLVERKPRPIQELLQNWERSPSPPPLLTGPPYRVKTESPESLKRLETRRGKIVVRGGSLIGLGLGFSPKEEETEDAAGCICDPLGLSGQDCWRKTSSSGGSRTRTASRDAEFDHDEDEMNPNAVSGVVAGVKRKSGDESKGKLRELQPVRPGTNTMLGKSNLELPAGQSAAHQAVQAPKRKKPRIALSCAQCTKRKQKCNRQIPCQHCTCEQMTSHRGFGRRH